MFCVVWYHLQVHTPSNALTYSNMFGFASIVETMDYSDEDSDYADVSASRSMTFNDTTIGVISKFHSEPYTNLTHCLLTYCCLSSLQSTLNPTKSILMKLQKKEGISFLHPLQITSSQEVLWGRRSPTSPIPKGSQYQQKVAVYGARNM